MPTCCLKGSTPSATSHSYVVNHQISPIRVDIRLTQGIQNGKQIGSTNNMFVHHRVSAKDALKEGENELLLTFWSGWNEAKKEQAANGGPVPCCESGSWSGPFAS